MVGVFPWQTGRNPPLFLDIPVNEYYEYFGPDYQLDVKSSNTEDLNSPAYLERVKGIVMEHLRHVGGPPSVQMTGTVPAPYDFQVILMLIYIKTPRYSCDAD